LALLFIGLATAGPTLGRDIAAFLGTLLAIAMAVVSGTALRMQALRIAPSKAVRVLETPDFGSITYSSLIM
jgi:hypothetical protein